MRTDTVPGLDLSFSPTSAQWWRDRYAEGYRIAVQNLWTGIVAPEHARPTLIAAQDAGLVIAGYAVVNDLPASHTIETARRAAGPLWRSLARVAIDAEEIPKTNTPLATLATIHDAVRILHQDGPPPCVYSRRSFWLSAYGDADATAPIWTTQRRKDPSLDKLRPWGHQPIIGNQRTGTVRIDGVDVDINTFDAAAFGIPTKEEEDDMNQATFNTMHDAAHAGGTARRYDTIRADGNCSALAARNGITLAHLRQLNPGKVSDLVHKGNRFRVT